MSACTTALSEGARPEPKTDRCDQFASGLGQARQFRSAAPTSRVHCLGHVVIPVLEHLVPEWLRLYISLDDEEPGGDLAADQGVSEERGETALVRALNCCAYRAIGTPPRVGSCDPRYDATASTQMQFSSESRIAQSLWGLPATTNQGQGRARTRAKASDEPDADLVFIQNSAFRH